MNSILCPPNFRSFCSITVKISSFKSFLWCVGWSFMCKSNHQSVLHWAALKLVWRYKIANSYKLNVKIFARYNFWKIGWVLFLPIWMKETDQSKFKFRNAELFWRKIYFNESSLNQVIYYFHKKFLYEVKKTHRGDYRK